jgi:hypothetical protein
MNVMAFDPHDFNLLSKLRENLHNAQKSMTFDEQRDFAERLRLLLERSQEVELQC